MSIKDKIYNRLNWTKNYYYNYAKENTSSIEEIDCLIEEYKNIKKISIPNSCSLIFSFGSLFLVCMNSLFTLNANVKSIVLSKIIDAFRKEFQTNVHVFDDFSFRSEMHKIEVQLGKTLIYISIFAIFLTLGVLLYNNYNQQRLAGLYKFKRELIREKNNAQTKAQTFTNSEGTKKLESL